MRENEKILDGTYIGPVIDKEGSMEKCFNNLERLLVHIFEPNPNCKKSKRVRVIKSTLRFKGNNPYRIEQDVITTVGILLKEYSSWNCGSNGFILEQVKNKLDFNFAMLEKEMERINAWSFYAYCMRIQQRSKN